MPQGSSAVRPTNGYNNNI